MVFGQAERRPSKAAMTGEREKKCGLEFRFVALESNNQALSTCGLSLIETLRSILVAKKL